MIEEGIPKADSRKILMNSHTDVAIVQMRAKFWMDSYLASQSNTLEHLPMLDASDAAKIGAEMADAALSQFDSRFLLLN